MRYFVAVIIEAIVLTCQQSPFNWALCPSHELVRRDGYLTDCFYNTILLRSKTISLCLLEFAQTHDLSLHTYLYPLPRAVS